MGLTKLVSFCLFVFYKKHVKNPPLLHLLTRGSLLLLIVFGGVERRVGWGSGLGGGKQHRMAIPFWFRLSNQLTYSSLKLCMLS